MGERQSLLLTPGCGSSRGSNRYGEQVVARSPSRCLLAARHFDDLEDQGRKSEQRGKQKANICEGHLLSFRCSSIAALGVMRRRGFWM